MKLISDNKTFKDLARVFQENQKYDFGAVIGQWSIKITKNLDIAKVILEAFNYGTYSWSFGLNVKFNTNQILIYDWDVLMNRKWAKIWLGRTPQETEIEIGIKLQIGPNEITYDLAGV